MDFIVELFKRYDIVVIIIDYLKYDYNFIVENVNFIFDIRNVIKGIKLGKVYKL